MRYSEVLLVAMYLLSSLTSLSLSPSNLDPFLLKVPRGASKSKPLRYEVSQRELEEMMRDQG